MKKILYIGNHLSVKGAYPSVAETLAPLLKPEYKLILVSRKRNRYLRMIDMILAVIFYNQRNQSVFIDVYSTQNFYYALIISLLCRTCNIPYTCVLHGGNLPTRLNRNPFLSRLIFKKSQWNIAPSNYLCRAFDAAGFQVEVIPNFIPIEKYNFKLRKEIGPRILWVRAFDSIYNPTMAIEVLSSLSTLYPNTELCMVGPDRDGSLAEIKKLTKERKMNNRVRFTGQLSKHEWIALSKEYDVFINTTDFDNTPVSIIEAMALGLPVVSTDAGGMPDLIVDGIDGLIVPKRDVLAMTAAIQKLIENDSFACTLSRNARIKVENYDRGIVVEQWKNILSNV